MKKVYVGLELASRGCVATAIDTKGKKLETRVLETSERSLISFTEGLKAKVHVLMEEGELADWAWRALNPYAHQVEISDPVRNAWIAKDPGKNDRVDSEKLAELARCGNYHPVCHLESLEMAHFKLAVKQYEKAAREVARQKNQVKALYRTQGIVTRGQGPWGARTRSECLDLLCADLRPVMLAELELLDELCSHRDGSRRRLAGMSSRFPVIGQFRRIPGCGPVSAARFVAWVGDPRRFSSKRKLWRYACLAVVHPETGGKPIGRERLDVRGCAQLKDVSRTIFEGAMRSRQDNLIKRTHRRSLAATGSDVHARLACQRKILAVMWAMWRDGTAYDDDIDIRA